MAIVISKPSPRTRLRKYLEGQLKLMEKSEFSQRPLLQEVIEGLVALDYGESQPMFTCGEKKLAPDNSKWNDGLKPYTLRKLRMEALGFIDLLKMHKYKGDEPSIRTVAEAYGEHAASVKGWRKKDGKTSDALMQSYRKQIASMPWSQEKVLDRLKQVGGQYGVQLCLAHPEKYPDMKHKDKTVKRKTASAG
jgi:hypothetical protein